MIVGAWQWPVYEEAFAKGLSVHGVTVSKFVLSEFFTGWISKIQKALPLPSPALLRLNLALIREVKNCHPDVILFWRPTLILPRTISRIKQLGVQTISYNNDDPFGPRIHGNVPRHHHFLWFWYLRCLSKFDRNYFYRRINCQEAIELGAKHTELLMPYFLPWQHRPVIIPSAEIDCFETDIVFVGHYEPDGREKSIRALVEAGFKIKIWGGKYWTRNILGDLYDKLQPIVPAEGDDYAKALCGAKVCLAFLSKLNRDTYTRRCFEIPACGRVMLAERTDDLMQMFKEDEEACFFSSDKELVQKVRWLLDNPKERERIAQAGMHRVWSDGHDVESRAKQFIRSLQL